MPCKWWPHEQISLALSLTSLEIWFINKTVWQSLEVSQRNSCYPSNQYSGFFRLSWPACRSWCLGEHLWAFFCLSYSSNIFSNSLWGNAWPMYFCLCFLVLVNCLEDNYVSGESDKVHLSQCLVLHAAQYSCFYFITMPLSQSIIRGLFTRSCSQFQLNSKYFFFFFIELSHLTVLPLTDYLWMFICPSTEFYCTIVTSTFPFLPVRISH